MPRNEGLAAVSAQHPELAFDCHETAAWISDRLRAMGVDEIHGGIAKTGIVALIFQPTEEDRGGGNVMVQ